MKATQLKLKPKPIPNCVQCKAVTYFSFNGVPYCGRHIPHGNGK